MRGDKISVNRISKNLLINLLIMVVVVGFSLPAIAEAPIKPGGPFIPPDKDANRSAIMTFDEVEAELLLLEQRSKGVMNLKVVGYTLEQRPLYIAKLGSGPKRMWIQGRIHGNEPYGNDACLEIIKNLLVCDRRILEELTFWIIPCYNPDGSERFWRWNAIRIDLNRDWWRSGGRGYSQPESKAFYWAWVDFKPHYAIDIHHQGTYLLKDEDGNETNQMTTFSLGISVRQELLELWIRDTSRRMAVVGYDAVRKLGFCNPSRFPPVNIQSAVASSMMMGNPGPNGHDAGWKTAAMFLENRGGIGHKSRGYLIKQNLVAVHAMIEAIAHGELTSVNEDRWDEIPDRTSRMLASGKWENEWAEHDSPAIEPDLDAGTVGSKDRAAAYACNESHPDAIANTGTPTLPEKFVLHQNMPNPFNPSTEIQYDVAGRGGKVMLRIYDAAGRLVRVLVDDVQIPGKKRVTWDGRNSRGNLAATGVYFYRMDAPGFAQTRKMILLK